MFTTRGFWCESFHVNRSHYDAWNTYLFFSFDNFWQQAGVRWDASQRVSYTHTYTLHWLHTSCKYSRHREIRLIIPVRSSLQTRPSSTWILAPSFSLLRHSPHLSIPVVSDRHPPCLPCFTQVLPLVRSRARSMQRNRHLSQPSLVRRGLTHHAWLSDKRVVYHGFLRPATVTPIRCTLRPRPLPLLTTTPTRWVGARDSKVEQGLW